MQRLVVEVGQSDFVKLSSDRSVGKIGRLEVLNFLKEDPEEFITICRVEFKDPSTTLDEAFHEEGSEVQVLDHDIRGGYTALIRGRPLHDPLFEDFLAGGGYLSVPFEIKDGKVKITFFGLPRKIRSLLNKLKKTGVPINVTHLTDASLPPRSPLNCLTERQRRVITSAYHLGYYDVPRKIKTRDLAKRLGIRGSTFATHRIKAERRLLTELLKDA